MSNPFTPTAVVTPICPLPDVPYAWWHVHRKGLQQRLRLLLQRWQSIDNFSQVMKTRGQPFQQYFLVVQPVLILKNNSTSMTIRSKENQIICLRILSSKHSLITTWISIQAHKTKWDRENFINLHSLVPQINTILQSFPTVWS